MEVHTVTIPYKSHEDKFYIVPIGDIHYGNKQCDTKYFENLIEWVRKTPNVYVVGMGDYTECILPKDKRWKHDIVSELSVSKQYDYIYRQFFKIKDRIIGIHSGNHGEKLAREFIDDFDMMLAERLGVKWLGWRAITTLRFKRNSRSTTFTIFSTHGAGGSSRTTGSKINRVEDLAKDFDADIYLMGHVHAVSGTSDIRVGVNSTGNRLLEKKRIFAITGTMLNTTTEGIDGYEARAGYPPTKRGVIKLRLMPEVKHDGVETKDMHISE